MAKACFITIFLIIIFFNIDLGIGKPSIPQDRIDAFVYLNNFGYINEDEFLPRNALLSDEFMSKAVKDFQVR